MDTIIDTRHFPKEMEEKIPQQGNGEYKKRGSSAFLWFIFFLIILGILYFAYTKIGGRQTQTRNRAEIEQKVINTFSESTTKTLPSTHERAVSSFFNE